MRRLAPEDGELVPEGQDLRLQGEARGDGGPDGGQQGNKRGDHVAGEGYQREAATSTCTRRSRY